jgi:hypothetical protein
MALTALTMEQVRKGILGTFTKEALISVMKNDAARIQYVGIMGEPLGNMGELEAQQVLDLPSVREIKIKAETDKPITLGEFDACINEIRTINAFLGWLLDADGSQMRATIRGGERTTQIS